MDSAEHTPLTAAPPARGLALTADESAASAAPVPLVTAQPPSEARTFGSGAIARVRDVLLHGRESIAKLLVRFILGATAAALPVVLLLPGTVAQKAAGVGAVAVLTVVFLALRLGEMRARREPDALFVTPLLALVGTSAGVTLHVVLGLFTPLPFAAVLGLLVIYLGVGSSEREARILYTCCALLYALAMGLVLMGFLPSTGLLQAEPVRRGSLWLHLAGTQMALGFSYVLAHTTGGYARKLLTRLDRAVRDASRREALLREARAELEYAAGLGGGGLFTGLELGAFVLGPVLGRGGMGEVYEATDRRDGTPVAVKLIRREAMAEAGALRRFEREARIVSALQNPHVVQIREVGGMEAPLPFIAMERLRGEDLASVLRTRGSLPVDEVLTLVEHCCHALRAAHGKGVVHRDLKPQNVFLHHDGETSLWKLLDFGVSKLVARDDATMASVHIVGTPSYMAPEQADPSAEVDHRADLYALAAVLYRALTGTPAFRNGAPASVLRAVAERMPEDPGRLARMPEDVVRVLRLGLAKAPADRFEDAAAFAQSFAAAVVGDLSAETRARADGLLARLPWGAERDAEPDPPGVSPTERATTAG